MGQQHLIGSVESFDYDTGYSKDMKKIPTTPSREGENADRLINIEVIRESDAKG